MYDYDTHSTINIILLFTRPVSWSKLYMAPTFLVMAVRLLRHKVRSG